MPTPITDVNGIGAATAVDLAAQGIKSAEDLASAPLDRIVAVKGFGPLRAEQIKQAAADALTALAEPVKAEEKPAKSAEKSKKSSKKAEKKEKKKQKDKNKKSKKNKDKKKKGKKKK